MIDNPSDRQAAGTVPVSTGIVPWVSVGGRAARPLWTADSVSQRYRRGTNVFVTTGRFGAMRVRITYAAGNSLACLTEVMHGVRIRLKKDRDCLPLSGPSARRCRASGTMQIRSSTLPIIPFIPSAVFYWKDSVPIAVARRCGCR